MSALQINLSFKQASLDTKDLETSAGRSLDAFPT